MMHHLKKLAATAATVALAFISAGCGAGAGGAGGETIVFASTGKNFADLPIYLADELGYYDDEGIEVEFKALKSGSDSMQAVVTGSVDITSGAYSSMLQAINQGQDLVYIAVGRAVPGYAIVVSPKHPEIKSLADLEGKRLGVSSPGGETYNFPRYILSEAGVALEDVTYSSIGLGSSAIAAMESGEVEAAVMLDPAISQLEARSDSDLTLLADTRTPDGTEEAVGSSDFPSTGLYTSADWPEENSDDLRKLMEGYVKGLEWLQNATPEEVVDLLGDDFGGADRDTLLAAVKANLPSFSTDGQITEEGARTALEVLITSQPDVEGIEIEGTYTNDYLQ